MRPMHEMKSDQAELVSCGTLAEQARGTWIAAVVICALVVLAVAACLAVPVVGHLWSAA